MGVGQFGVVVQAQQIGTVQNPTENKVTTVAVKMAKSALNTTCLESLASELKILIHLGPHLNVVNLLGACTKEIDNGLYIILYTIPVILRKQDINGFQLRCKYFIQGSF